MLFSISDFFYSPMNRSNSAKALSTIAFRCESCHSQISLSIDCMKILQFLQDFHFIWQLAYTAHQVVHHTWYHIQETEKSMWRARVDAVTKWKGIFVLGTSCKRMGKQRPHNMKTTNIF